jgi:hypothetical protein
VGRRIAHLKFECVGPDTMVTTMTVIETTLATGPRESSKHPRVIDVAGLCVGWFLARVLPAANPDFEGTYDNINKWWVEIDHAGVPQRELDFDASGEIIVAGPIGKNMGFWTDSHMTFDAAENEVVPNDEFESARSTFEASHPAMAD